MDDTSQLFCYGNPNAKAKSVVVLNRLVRGDRAEFGGYTWALDADLRLCVVGHNETTGKEVLLVADYSMSEFLHLTSRITDEELINIGFTATMEDVIHDRS